MLFDDIEVLLVLSKAKSLSQAAGQLYMSRPGLSQKIAAIEKQLGTSLINRTSTGISLTQAGKVAVKFAQNMADMERVMASQIAAIDEHFPANITVGMSYADGVTLLPRLVALYMRENPEARVYLDAGYEPELVQKLKDGELDFAILENQPTEPGHRDRGARLQAPCLPGARQGSLQPGGRIGSHRDAAEVAHDRLRVAFRTPYGGQPATSGNATGILRCAITTWWAASTPTRPWWKA